MLAAHKFPVVFECHACERIEHRARPIMPCDWTQIAIDGEACALCPDCSPGDEIAGAPADPLIEDLEHVEAAAIVAEIVHAIDRRVMPPLYSLLALGFAVELAAQISIRLA